MFDVALIALASATNENRQGAEPAEGGGPRCWHIEDELTDKREWRLACRVMAVLSFQLVKCVRGC